MRDVGAEQLLDAFDRGLGILDDVVKQAGRDRDHVKLHVGQQVGDFERVDQVGFARVAHLSLVFEGGKNVGPPQQVNVGIRVNPPYLFDEVLEPNHGEWCLKIAEGSRPVIPVDAVFLRSLYWPGSGSGNPPVCASSAGDRKHGRYLHCNTQLSAGWQPMLRRRISRGA